MNRIGEFIAKERKAKGMTQMQLSEKLGISNKTVSKWECGSGLPEMSLLLPLCEELGITASELLSGQRLDSAEYRRKAEEIIMEFMHEREENKKKYIITAICGFIATLAFVTILILVELYGEAMSTFARVAFTVVAWLIFAAGLSVAVYGELKSGYYKCARCGERFVPTLGAYIAGPHIGSTRKLKCPKCGEKSWCRKVMSKED